jgi:hypothetical protein
VILAAGLVLYGGTASAQTQVTGQKPLYPHAPAQVDVDARIDLLDERIALLTGDMKMFVGELKIQAMADLIEALVERVKLNDRRVRHMRDMIEGPIGKWMPHSHGPSSRPAPEPDADLDPEVMCSPFI